MNIKEITARAKAAARLTRNLSIETRNGVLMQFACNLRSAEQKIIAANQIDLENARLNGMKTSFLDRLTLTASSIEAIATGVEQTASLPDPLHMVLEDRILTSGVHLKKTSTAIGVIGIIFESRPNVCADCAALTFKSGNACILKGGKDSYHSCVAITEAMHDALRKYGVSKDAVILLEHPDHAETQAWISDRNSMDLLIPRGSSRLIRSVVDNARVPVIETGAGICHVYVDETADLQMAVNIVINAKCQRPSVCNAMETLLIQKCTAERFLSLLAPALKEHGVQVFADEYACSIIPSFEKGSEENWNTEYNDLIMNIVTVEGVREAVNHIENHGTHHSESIVSSDENAVSYFMNNVDSACIYHNVSTRFTYGFEFGLGAEIGISTQKMHARGPMGLQALTTVTYHLDGNGECRK